MNQEFKIRLQGENYWAYMNKKEVGRHLFLILTKYLTAQLAQLDLVCFFTIDLRFCVNPELFSLPICVSVDQ